MHVFLRVLNMYHHLSGINDCPSVGFDMASNSCPHEKVIRCPCVRIMTSTLFKQAPASTDDETPGQLGKKEQELCVFLSLFSILHFTASCPQSQTVTN